jgi:minor extracellular serine protease Vpr
VRSASTPRRERFQPPLPRLAILSLLLLVGATGAAGAATRDESPAQQRSIWFVELSRAPSVEGESRAALDAEHAAFRANVKSRNVALRERYDYSTLFNGFAVSATDDEIAEIQAIDGVTAVERVQAIALDDDDPVSVGGTIEPAITFATTMTGADIARTKLGFTGRGVRVALIDTGIDYDHPDLGGCFGPRCRVSMGYDFVGDDYDADPTDPAYQPVAHPDPDPDDCNGHGTHVAGIIGAKGVITGVAPEVTLHAYRAFSCAGLTSSDVVLAALERAYRDGVDVVNMSISESLETWPGSPTAAAADRLVDKGIVVVGAAGNDRFEGMWGGGAPGVAEGVISVAAIDNIKQYVPGFKITPDGRGVPYLHAADSPSVPENGTVDIARTGTVDTTDDACAPLVPMSLAGKAALIRRGTCGFAVKEANAAAAGAAAVILYNNIPGNFPPAAAGSPVPVLAISQADGVTINQFLDLGRVELTWGFAVAVPNSTGGLLSFFSSYGLAADLSLKPDIAAPGGSIRSTWPLERGGYAVESGTSMATPHVAGAVALFLQAHRGATPREVRDALQNSADPVPWALAPTAGFLDYVARQGAGLLDIDDAILATTTITPGKLSLGDTVNSSGAQDRNGGNEVGDRLPKLTVANNGATPVTYALGHVDGLAIAAGALGDEHPQLGPSAVSFAADGAPVSTITLGPRERKRVEVTVVPRSGLTEGTVYGGWIVLTPPSGPPLRVPYAGYIGDYQGIPAMTPTTRGFPWLARATGLSVDPDSHIRPIYTKVGPSELFTFAPRTLTTVPPSALTRPAFDAPSVVIHINHPARRLRGEIFKVGSRQPLGKVFEEEFVARNPFDGPLAAPWRATMSFPLDGRVRVGRRSFLLPDGEYYVVVTAERALADRDTPVDTWTSPTFTVDR